MEEKRWYERKGTIFALHILVLAILFAPVIYGTLQGYSAPSQDGALRFDAPFSIFKDDVFLAKTELPYIVPATEDASYSLYSVLPGQIKAGEYLVFFTKQTGLKVYIGDELRYSWVIEDDYIGYPEIRVFHAVRLYPEDAGKELKTVYPSSSVILPRLELGAVMIGSSSALFHYIFDFYKVMIILIPFFLTLGLFIVLIAVFSRGNIYAGTIFSFGVLVLLLSVNLFSSSILFSLVGNNPVLMGLIHRTCLLLEPFVVFMILHDISRSGSMLKLYGGFHLAAVFFCIYYVVIGVLELFGIAGYDSFDNIFLVLVPIYELFLVHAAIKHHLLGSGRWRYLYYIAIILLVVKNIVSLLASGIVTYDMYADLIIEICTMLSIVLFILEGVFTYFGDHDMIVNVSGYILKSHYDRLSELMNRRGFENWKETHVRSSDKPCYVVAFDINEMKKINDRFGHLVGDEVIRLLGRSIKSQLGDDDAGFRMGGDEFTVFLQGDEERAISLISFVQEELRAHGTSVSCAYLPFSADADVLKVMAECDRMLYMNKKAYGKGGKR